MTGRRGTNHKGAVGHSFGQARVLCGALQQRRCSHSRAGLAKRRFIGIHHTQMAKTKVAHSTRSRADVERVTRGDKHNAQTVMFTQCRQECLFYDMDFSLWFNPIYSARPAAAPDAQAHWKLKPPRWPVTSTTSPIKNRPGTLRLSIVLADNSSVSTPPAVTSALA